MDVSSFLDVPPESGKPLKERLVEFFATTLEVVLSKECQRRLDYDRELENANLLMSIFVDHKCWDFHAYPLR